MNTSELTGAALDRAVAEIENPKPEFYRDNEGLEWEREYKPSTDWAQGGSIIEREGFCIQPFKGGWECFVAHRLFEDDHHHSKGPTPLIAAMRCYVASKLGDDIDLPKELT
jgi:hypothetical protein